VSDFFWQVGAEFPEFQLTLISSKVDEKAAAAAGACANVNRDVCAISADDTYIFHPSFETVENRHYVNFLS
jgi:hypothetical protein